MTARIGDYVLAGELRNNRRNGVFGWLEFSAEIGIRIELTGNLSGALEGKHIRFEVAGAESKRKINPDDLPDVVCQLSDRQIGVTGDILLQKVKVPDIPIDEFLDLPTSQQEQHLEEKNCLYLEWYSQNGRVLAEIVEPIIEVIEPEVENGSLDEEDFEPIPEDYGTGITEIHIDESGVPHVQESFVEDEDFDDEELDDPYGLFEGDIEKDVADSLKGSESEGSSLLDSIINQPRDWDDLDLDPETQAMYEIFEGKKDEPISYLFETPLKLPKPDRVTTDEEAEPLVRSILAQLARLSVALDVCEHFSSVQTYQVLMNEILPTAKVHPNLAASDMVQHYSTSDFCEECETEFDEEYGSEEGEG